MRFGLSEAHWQRTFWEALGTPLAALFWLPSETPLRSLGWRFSSGPKAIPEGSRARV
jgi:hypothetical protein